MGGLIVCVDDRRDLLAALMRDLSELSGEFELVACESELEARQALDESPAMPVRLVISNDEQALPGPRHETTALDQAPRLVISGNTSEPPGDFSPQLIRNGERLQGLLPKPWSQQNLLETVRALLV